MESDSGNQSDAEPNQPLHYSPSPSEDEGLPSRSYSSELEDPGLQMHEDSEQLDDSHPSDENWESDSSEEDSPMSTDEELTDPPPVQEGRFASPPTGEDSIIFPLQQEGCVDSSPAAPTSQIDWVFQEDWIAVGVPCQSQGRVSLNPDWEDEQAEEITSLPSEEERIPSTHPYEENNNPDPECSSEGTHPFAVDDREEDITEDNEGLTQTILLTPETHHMVPLTPMPMGSETTYRLKFAEQKVHYYIPTPTMKVTFLSRHLRTMHNTEPAKNRTSKQGYIYRRCPVDACGKTVARLRLHLRRMYAIQEANSLRSLIGRAEILTKDSSDEEDVQ